MRFSTVRAAMRWIMVLFYFGAGVLHLTSPAGFVKIVPDWVPFPREVITVTGVAEIFGAVGLMVPRLRWLAGLLLAGYAVVVYPANIKHAVDGIAIGGVALGWWYHFPRLAFQPVLVWWALFAGEVTHWPWRRHFR